MARGRRREERFLDRLAGAAKKESPARVFVQLAWAAGPVTYLALQGGYFLGYGEAAPTNLLLYFAGYTVIAGVIAAVSRILYTATRGHAARQAREDLMTVLDLLPDLILRARNLSLSYYGESSRRILAAGYLLENPDTPEPAIVVAVEDLTGRRDLALAAGRIEAYRRQGLFARVADLTETWAEARLEVVAELSERAPVTAGLLDKRLTGRAPTKREGRERVEGFLGRALAAVETGEQELLSLPDVEEIITLVIEVIAGRRIELIVADYVGDRRYAEAALELERARRSFRRASRSVSSRLRLLAETLNRTTAVEAIAAASVRLRHLGRLWQEVRHGLEETAGRLEEALGTGRLTPADREAGRRFLRARTLYRLLDRSLEQADRAESRLERARRSYDEVRTSGGRRGPVRLVTGTNGADTQGEPYAFGIRLRVEELAPDEETRLKLAAATRRLIDRTGIAAPGSPTTEALKEFTVALVGLLEDFLPLHRLPVQVAVESGRASFVGGIEEGLTAQTKAGWIAALAGAVEPVWDAKLRRLLQVLIDEHGLSLSENGARMLASRFGVDADELRSLTPAPPGKVEASRLVRREPWPGRYDRLAALVERALRSR